MIIHFTLCNPKNCSRRVALRRVAFIHGSCDIIYDSFVIGEFDDILIIMYYRRIRQWYDYKISCLQFFRSIFPTMSWKCNAFIITVFTMLYYYYNTSSAENILFDILNICRAEGSAMCISSKQNGALLSFRLHTISYHRPNE